MSILNNPMSKLSIFVKFVKYHLFEQKMCLFVKCNILTWKSSVNHCPNTIWVMLDWSLIVIESHSHKLVLGIM